MLSSEIFPGHVIMNWDEVLIIEHKQFGCLLLKNECCAASTKDTNDGQRTDSTVYMKVLK